MTGMEHAIEQVAQVLNDEGACCGDCGREPGAPLSECAACERFLTGYARALAEAGWLAPAPLREEWGAEMDHPIPGRPPSTIKARDLENARWQVEHNPKVATGRIMHRYVSASDWLPVERAEGDGSAEQ